MTRPAPAWQAVLGRDERFVQIPLEVRRRLAGNEHLIATWLDLAAHPAIWGGGGAGEIAQAQLWRQAPGRKAARRGQQPPAHIAPSTWFRNRLRLQQLGLLEVAPAAGGPQRGPGARRRLTLVHWRQPRTQARQQPTGPGAPRRARIRGTRPAPGGPPSDPRGPPTPGSQPLSPAENAKRAQAVLRQLTTPDS